MTGFKETLKDAVRQMSFRTSIDSLKKKGVQKVNVLGDRVTDLDSSIEFNPYQVQFVRVPLPKE